MNSTQFSAEAISADTLQLRPLTTSCVDDFSEAVAASATEITRWLGPTAAPQTPEAVAAYVASWEAARAAGSGYGFVAEAAGRCVGFGLLNHVHPVHRFANVGYWIRTDATGHGFAPALVQRLAEFAFGTLGLQRLELVIEPDNAPSRRVAEKVGAHLEGLLHHRLCVAGAPRDGLMYGLFPEDVPA